LLDVNRDVTPIPHASGYSLNVVQAGRPLLLDERHTSPPDWFNEPADSATGISLLPERTIWAWGERAADAWGILGDGRLYYLDSGEPSKNGGEAQSASIAVLPNVSAPLEQTLVWRSERNSMILLVLPTSDERYLLLVRWDSTLRSSSLSSIRLDAGNIADQAERTIFETDLYIVRPILQRRGSGLLLGVSDDDMVGSDCSVGCDKLTHYLLLDPAEGQPIKLPAGLRIASFTPDDAGIVGILNGDAVYLPVETPDRIHRLCEADYLELPSVWPVEDSR